jgi:oligoendopeptidase F
MKPTSYSQRRWSLNDLFSAPDGPEIEKAFKSIEKNVKAFEALRPKLNDAISSADFMDVIHKLEATESLAYRVGGYASLLFAEDTQNQKALSLMARVDQFMAQMSNRVLFFSLWWKSVPDKAADRLLAGSGDYRYWLEQIRHFKPHTLSEAEEKIINIKNVTGSSALNTLYETITNRYVFKVKVGNKTHELTRGGLMTYARGSDPELRARAYQELYRVYGNDGPILGQMYQNLTRDWRNENMDLRNYKTPIAARNLGNDIPDPVVDTLLDVCQKNTSVFQRYFQLKAKWLGMKHLRRYDIYAPVAKSNKRYSFEKASGLVFESFDQFDPQFAAMAEQVLKENHLDSEVRKGKRDGAFCSTLGPDLTPWVLTNFQGKADDVATLAHELGHAIHSQMAAQHSLYTQQACLPLAETASTFGEMMLVDKLLKEEKDEAVRRDLLFRQVDDAYATIQRQAFFALFERQAHDMVQKGASVDDLTAAYLENLKAQFGKAVEVSDEFKWEWVSIPHIYNVPFYVYAYAFGQLLVFSLYRQFKKEGDAFKPRYKKILATGGSQAPAALLKDAGIDIRKAAFWQGGFDVVSELVSQLEAIPVKK